MPASPPPAANGPDGDAEALVRAASIAMDGAGDSDAAMLRDLAWRDDQRVDERTLATLRARLAAAARPVERSLRLSAAAHLAAMQAPGAAERMLDDGASIAADLLRLAARGSAVILMELLAIVRLEMLAQALPAVATVGADRPSLLVRLVGCPEPEIAHAASALLAAENRQSVDAPPPLPEPMWTQIVWWTAALLRDRLGSGSVDDPRHDHAISEAAAELLERAPTDSSPADAAMHLAGLVRARPDELAALLLEALGDRRPTLFVALLAQASGLAFDPVRAALTDAGGERLWLLLRAQDMDRTTLARIGVALADADPRRDLERFATMLDAAMAVDPERAAHVFAAATLPAAYREALSAVAGLR